MAWPDRLDILDFKKLKWLCEQRGIEVEESGKAKVKPEAMPS